MGLEDEIQEIEEEIASTPYNKSTEEHIGRLKAKLSDLKDELEDRQSSSQGGSGYAVEQTGDATVSLVGFPSVGKSTLLNQLTGAESETGSYEFTTLEVNPGILKYKGANIQILDVPGLIEGASGGRGGGKKVLSVVRSSDLIVFMLSPYKLEEYELLEQELYDNKIRLDSRPPKVRVSKKGKGGIQVNKSSEVSLDKSTIKSVLRERGFVNAEVVVHEDVSIDELIDGVADNRSYIDTVVCVNKIDSIDQSYTDRLKTDIRETVGIEPTDAVYISAKKGKGIDSLKKNIWSSLDLRRIYLDKPGRGVDYEDPLITEGETTVGEVCEQISSEWVERFKFARVTGESAKHDSQQVGKDHTLRDEDVLRIVKS